MKFLLWDDSDERGFFASRKQHEVMPEYHNMAVGEYRRIGDGIWIVRES